MPIFSGRSEVTSDDFSDEPAGAIAIGPLACDYDGFTAALAACGLRIAWGRGTGIERFRADGGLWVFARGPGVLGYLVDRECLEADKSRIERLGEAVVEAGGQLTIRGHHYLSDRAMALTCTTVRRGEDHGIDVEVDRRLFRAGQGAIKPVGDGMGGRRK